jgi:hypothetical protein
MKFEMKQITFFLLISGILFSISQTSCPAQKLSAEDKYAEIKAEKFLKIQEIKAQKPAPGIYETEGFVAKIYTCPPCPPNAQCKPCMRDNIVISEENKSLDSYDLTDREIIVFTQETKTFEKGKKYLFKIRITDKKTTSEAINDIELLGFKAVEN